MEVQVVVERDGVQGLADITTGNQGRQAGGEAQALAGARQVQGFDPEAVAGDKQLLAVALPYGEGEHAVELGQQRLTPGVIALEQHFGVAIGEKAVAQVLQLVAQFRVVVDGTVEHHRQAQVAVDHRLAGSFGQVHDLQPAMAEGNRALAMEAVGVGATRGQVVGDALNRSQVGRALIKT